MIIHPSIHPDELPAHLQNLADGRMQAGAFHDNAGLCRTRGWPVRRCRTGSGACCSALTGSYVGWNADWHAEVRLGEVASHLDETWFSWYGGYDDDSPFYYRVHSPVILIEFDHHPGVVFDNEVPTRHHVHSAGAYAQRWRLRH